MMQAHEDATNKLDFSNISSFDIYDWKPSPEITVDENYLDLACMVCRASVCIQGLMGCVFVRAGGDGGDRKQQQQQQQQQVDPTSSTPPQPLEWYLSNIVSCSVNTPFYKPLTSDLHAEINSISHCSKRGIATAGCTAYITMPPCKDCFQALWVAGVRRIVSRQRPCEAVQTAMAEMSDLTMVDIRDTPESLARRADVVTRSGRGKSREQVENERKRRKEYKIADAAAKKRKKLEDAEALEERKRGRAEVAARAGANGAPREPTAAAVAPTTSKEEANK
jgi:deoxycytidylate deaminase